MSTSKGKRLSRSKPPAKRPYTLNLEGLGVNLIVDHQSPLGYRERAMEIDSFRKGLTQAQGLLLAVGERGAEQKTYSDQVLVRLIGRNLNNTIMIFVKEATYIITDTENINDLLAIDTNDSEIKPFKILPRESPSQERDACNKVARYLRDCGVKTLGAFSGLSEAKGSLVRTWMSSMFLYGMRTKNVTHLVSPFQQLATIATDDEVALHEDKDGKIITKHFLRRCDRGNAKIETLGQDCTDFAEKMKAHPEKKIATEISEERPVPKDKKYSSNQHSKDEQKSIDELFNGLTEADLFGQF